MTKYLLMSLILLTVLGCTHSIPLHDADKFKPPAMAMDGLKIGLLADSQIQTEKNYGGVALISGKLSDIPIDVALRPYALNYASRYMLDRFLAELKANGANVIFYLGDAANNGCTDEIEALIGTSGVLTLFRANSGIPLYFLIGNHDYTGGGNTTDIDARKELCNGKKQPVKNTPLAKLDLMKKVRAFNDESYNRFSNKADWVFYKPSFTDDPSIDKFCQVSSEDQQHQNDGCYLSTLLKYKDGSEFLLVDTSDYFDKKTHLAIPFMEDKEYWGSTGWISTTGKSQLSWFTNQPHNGNVPTKIIVSHYPLRDLGPFARSYLGKMFTWFIGNGGLPERLAPLLDGRAEIGNYWLSAHTHDEHKGTKEYLGSYPVHSVNIGSTTDWQPHAALVQIASQDANAAGVSKGDVIFDRIALQFDDKKGNMIDGFIKNQCAGGGDKAGTYQAINSHNCGMPIFGMDKSYRENKWNQAAYGTAAANFQILVRKLTADPAIGLSREEIITYLGMISSKRESKRF